MEGAGVFDRCLTPPLTGSLGRTHSILFPWAPPPINGLGPFTAEGALTSPFPQCLPASPLVPWLFPEEPGLITLPLLPQPEDLEAPKTHHFKVKTFKKVKPCGICRQVITREGCTCKGEQLAGPRGMGSTSSRE